MSSAGRHCWTWAVSVSSTWLVNLLRISPDCVANINDVCKAIEESRKTNKNREVYESIRKITGKLTSKTSVIKGKDGNDNDNDFLTQWNESGIKYLHMRRWDEKIITNEDEWGDLECQKKPTKQEWKLDGGLFSDTILNNSRPYNRWYEMIWVIQC